MKSCQVAAEYQDNVRHRRVDTCEAPRVRMYMLPGAPFRASTCRTSTSFLLGLLHNIACHTISCSLPRLHILLHACHMLQASASTLQSIVSSDTPALPPRMCLATTPFAPCASTSTPYTLLRRVYRLKPPAQRVRRAHVPPMGRQRRRARRQRQDSGEELRHRPGHARVACGQ
jgi:hypothetical protein